MTLHTNSDSSQTGHSVIIKSVRHFRLENERDVLKQFHGRSPFIRPLLDEIIEPQDPPAIVLKHLDDNLLNASATKDLSKEEIKYVARRVLEALDVLHKDGFVHTGPYNRAYYLPLNLDSDLTYVKIDIKPNNVLVNYRTGAGSIRFTDVQLADFGSTVPATSKYATDGDMIGAPIWRSPEAQLGIGWNTSTDIWSFGTMVRMKDTLLERSRVSVLRLTFALSLSL